VGFSDGLSMTYFTTYILKVHKKVFDRNTISFFVVSSVDGGSPNIVEKFHNPHNSAFMSQSTRRFENTKVK
jgi:hypothetical protein